MNISKIKVMLIKGRSYAGFGVKVKNTEPQITVKPHIADSLLATGRFKLIENIYEGTKEKSEKSIDLSKMTAIQLGAYATELGVDISNLKTKAEKIAEIQNFTGIEESIIDYGEDE